VGVVEPDDLKGRMQARYTAEGVLQEKAGMLVAKIIEFYMIQKHLLNTLREGVTRPCLV
jgi:hypothetical protein